MDKQKSKNNLARIAFLIFAITATQVYAQINFTGVGGGIGFGKLSSNSPGVTSFGGEFSIDLKMWFSNEISFRFSYLHARDADYFFSQSKLINNYPFINSYSLKAYLDQPISESLLIEEGVGLILLNDHFLSGNNFWGVGTAFHIMPYLDFKNESNTGIKVGLKIEYGFTFDAEIADYSLFSLQAFYYFKTN